MHPWHLPILETLVSKFRGPGDAGLQCYSTHVGSLPHTSEGEALNVEIEEADEKIVPNLMHYILDGMQRIVVLSADNDVFMLMMCYFDEFCCQGLNQLWVKAGIEVMARFLPVYTLVEQIGPNPCQVLPAVLMLHSLSWKLLFQELEQSSGNLRT